MSPPKPTPPPAVTEVSVPPEGRADDARAFAAVGSRVRMAMLGELSTKARTVADLMRALGIQRPTVRYHLAFLLRHGLVEEVPLSKGGKVGRPAGLYRAARRAALPAFPRRHYELLAEVTLDAIVNELGQERAASRLREKGREAGRAMIQATASKTGVHAWTAESFRRLVLEGAFQEFGVRSEVVEETREGLHYRSFTCPFLEMAEKLPDLVCDALDAGFHMGVDEALGAVTTERRACMGHGDLYCEYVSVWRTERARRGHRAREKEEIDDGKGRRSGPEKEGS